MKLVDITNGKLIEPGNEVTTFRGEKARLISATPPHRMGSAGKVLVEFEKDNNYRMEYYPSVIGAVFVEE